MQIRANAVVISADGKDLGHVRRVVIDPLNDQIRDIVVRKGTVFSEDRVVPVELVTETNADKVRLTINAKTAESLELFEESFYTPANGETDLLPGQVAPTAFAPAYYWYPPMVGYEPGNVSAAISPELLGYELHHERHIPANTVALKEGAGVKTRDGQAVGKVERVVAAAGGGQVSHIVVSEGRLNKTHKVIPLDWVSSIKEDEVDLAVPAAVVEKLPVYEH